MRYVYILKSVSRPEKTYVGVTGDLRKRLVAHNEKASIYTAKFGPWKLVTYVAFSDVEKAREFERYLKTGSGKAFSRRRL